MWNPKRLQTARLEAGLTQEELARRAGCSNSALRGWENGRAIPSYNVVLSISNILGFSMEYFSYE